MAVAAARAAPIAVEVSLDTNELSLHFKAATRSQPPPPPPEDGEEPVDLSGSLGSLR